MVISSNHEQILRMSEQVQNFSTLVLLTATGWRVRGGGGFYIIFFINIIIISILFLILNFIINISFLFALNFTFRF